MNELQHVHISPSATTNNDTREQAKESMFGPGIILRGTVVGLDSARSGKR